MKKILKTLLISFGFLLALGSACLAEAADTWVPEGELSDFEGDISAYVSVENADILPDTADNIFEANGCAIRFKHQKLTGGTVWQQYIKPLNKSLKFNERKDYIISFDFKTDTVSEVQRYICCYNEVQERQDIIQINNSDGVLYLMDDWGMPDSKIAELSLNEPHHIELVIDGETRKLYEIWVDGTKRDFNLSHFINHPLPETISKIGIIQKSWNDNGYSYYDNFCLMALDDTINNVSYDIGDNKDCLAFGNNSDITVRAAIRTNTDSDGNMYLAVYDGDGLSDIRAYNVSLKKGMNYPKGSISIDSNQKQLKVFMWDNKLTPLAPTDILKGNLPLLEYKARIKSAISQSGELPKNEDISEILAKANDDGSFSDIKYTKLTVDFCYEHCHRLLSLALALDKKDYDWGAVSKDEARAVLNSGTEFWTGIDTSSFKFDNWYYENITVPEYMGKVLVLADGSDILDTETINSLAGYMALKVSEIDDVSKRDSGSNILQEQRNKSYYALYLEDTAMLVDCFNRIGREMRLSGEMTEVSDLWRIDSWETSVTVEGLPDTICGIQSDYSSLFHGPQLYSGTYGLTFLGGVSRILSDAKGLELFDDSRAENIIDHILEHYAYIGRGETLDYNTVSRMISTKGSTTKSGNFNEVYTAAENLLSLGLDYRRDELAAFAGSKNSSPSVTGHKYFYKADYTAHTKADYLFTLKAASNRTIASEALNYMNLKGRSLGDGVTFIYKTGREYDDIFAAWDWYKLPGTTAEVKAFDAITSPTYTYSSTESARVGGVSDGKNGMTAMELIRDGLSAKKAWFMFDDAVVALGTDVTSDSENKLYTSVNQCLSEGSVLYADTHGEQDSLPLGSDETKLLNPSWVLHGGIGYVFDGSTNIYAENKEKSGDRYDISWDGASEKLKSEIINRDIFTLWFDHSAEQSSKYSYIIIPNATVEKLQGCTAANPLVIVANESDIQAVKNTATGEYQAVFWTAGAAVDFDEFSISADKEALITVKTENGKLVLSIASLTQSTDDITVTINSTEYKIEMPKGEYAGDTKTVDIAVN